MARRLAHGEGFTTGVVYPAELWLGAGRDHPAVKFPPLWPMLLAGPFALFGADSRTALAVTAVLFVALVATSGALATKLAGRGAGALAALAVATSPLLLSLSIDGLSEIPFALAVTAVFLLCALEAPPALIGVVCGLAYLTRYNGAVLLPMVLALLAARRVAPRSLLVCAGCFGLVALPWWLRNAFVAGSPFYSLLNLNLYIAPVMTRVGGSLFFQLEPDLQSGVAADPVEKLLEQLPLLLLQFPLASANLAAFAGVVLGCWRRDALSLGLAFCAGATLLVVALALALGRYFAPFLPAMLALGVAGFVRYGGRGRALGLVLVLLTPLLPSLPAELPDVALIRGWPAWARERAARGWQAPPVSPCLAERPLVIAQEAARIAWQHDLVAIYAPALPERIRQIATTQPVAFAWLPDAQRVPSEGFRARPDCGAGWYETLGSQ
jgi:4-amino-4-deoxy-L-arabinose transferase-like glycosyltransferase